MSSKNIINVNTNILHSFDDKYPQKLITKLGAKAPEFFYTMGNDDLCNKKGISVVGVRETYGCDEEVSKRIGKICATEGMNLITGGANGVDTYAAEAALLCGGSCILYTSGGFNKSSFIKKNIKYINMGKLLCLSELAPDKDFSKYYALKRNKYIHCHGDISITVHAKLRKGGSWAGAYDNLINMHTPAVVCGTYYSGNEELIRMGAYCLNYEELFECNFSFESLSSRLKG